MGGQCLVQGAVVWDWSLSEPPGAEESQDGGGLLEPHPEHPARVLDQSALWNKARGVLHYTVVFPSFQNLPTSTGQPDPPGWVALAGTHAPEGGGGGGGDETAAQSVAQMRAKQPGNDKGMYPGKSDRK